MGYRSGKGGKLVTTRRKSRGLARVMLAAGAAGVLVLAGACSSEDSSSESADSGDATSDSADSGSDDSGSDDSGSDDSGGADAAEEEAPKELVKIKYVQPWVIQGESAGQFAAVEQGFFAEEGLDVEIIPGGPDVRAGALCQQVSDFAVMNPAGIYATAQQDSSRRCRWD